MNFKWRHPSSSSALNHFSNSHSTVVVGCKPSASFRTGEVSTCDTAAPQYLLTTCTRTLPSCANKFLINVFLSFWWLAGYHNWERYIRGTALKYVFQSYRKSMNLETAYTVYIFRDCLYCIYIQSYRKSMNLETDYLQYIFKASENLWI